MVKSTKGGKMCSLNNFSLEEFVGKKFVQLHISNPYLLKFFWTVFYDKNIKRKDQVLPYFILILEEFIDAPPLISEEAYEQASKENLNLETYNQEIDLFAKHAFPDEDESAVRAVSMMITISYMISQESDQEITKKYLGRLLKIIRIEKEKK